jgi:hypothetical protein
LFEKCISTGGLLYKTASGNAFPLAVFLFSRQWKCTFHWRSVKKTASENALFTGGSKITASGNADFH